MSGTCVKHGMTLDLFCLSHNIAVCALCSQQDHFKCPQFVPVHEAAKYANQQQLPAKQSLSDDEKIRSEQLLNKVKTERNTFTNFVQAAIESGEDNTFTKYLKGNEIANDKDDRKLCDTPLTTSRDFEVGSKYDTTEETFVDPSDPDDPHTARLTSEGPQYVRTSQEFEKPRSHPVTTSSHNTEGKTEVGQLLDDVRKFSKALSSRDDVGITLDDLLFKIERTQNEIIENFDNTKKQKSSIESRISMLRAKLNAHLDHLENKLLNSLKTRFSQCEATVANTIEKLQKGKTEVLHMKNGHVDNPNSQLQANTLLAIRENDKQMKRLKRSINTLAENVYAIDLDIRLNQELDIFVNDVQSFGEVVLNTRLNPKVTDPIVEKQRIEVVRRDTKRSPFQTAPKSNRERKPVVRSESERTRKVNVPKRTGSNREVVTSKRMDNVQPLPEIELSHRLDLIDEPLPEIITTSRSGLAGLRILQKKKIKIGHKWTSSVSNCKMLPNGRLIFIDTENKRLVIHNKDTYVYRNLRVHDPPRDFTILDDDRIAVTFGVYIEFLNILTSRIEKRIRLEFFECNGISYMDGKFYIYGIFEGYLLSRHGIQIMDMNGKIEDRLPITRAQTIHHSIGAWNGRIYYTSYDSVACCTTSGEEIWVFKHDTFERPKSVTVDGFGNAFACYENENKIVVISVDGLYSKEFELRKYDLYYGQEPHPISLFFDNLEAALIVCNANKDHSVMYFVKYG